MEVVGRRGRDRRTSKWECILIMHVFGLQMLIRQWRKERKKEADVPWQKHLSQSAEATAPCAVAAFLVSLFGCWLEVGEERRPSRSSSSLRTAALRGGGSGVAAFAFPFAFSDFIG